MELTDNEREQLATARAAIIARLQNFHDDPKAHEKIMDMLHCADTITEMLGKKK